MCCRAKRGSASRIVITISGMPIKCAAPSAKFQPDASHAGMIPAFYARYMYSSLSSPYPVPHGNGFNPVSDAAIDMQHARQGQARAITQQAIVMLIVMPIPSRSGEILYAVSNGQFGATPSRRYADNGRDKQYAVITSRQNPGGPDERINRQEAPYGLMMVPVDRHIPREIALNGDIEEPR